ncbi:hypothetical protein OKW40_006927 [Paraburkholderia sp. RAU6.4a]
MLNRPNFSAMSRTGIIRIWIGTKLPATNANSTAVLPGKRYVANAKPAIDASTIAPITDGTVISTLLAK